MAFVGPISKRSLAGGYAGAVPMLHSFNKALLFLGLLILVLTATSFLFFLLMYILLIFFCFWLKIPFSLLAKRMVFPFIIVAGLILLNSFQFGETELFSLALFNQELSFYLEGFHKGLFFGLRVLNAVTAVIIFSLVTTFKEILALARSFKIPSALVELVIYAFNFSFYLGEEASRIASAQKIRLGHSNRKLLLSSYGTLGGIIFIRAYDRAKKVSKAQRLRCYQDVLYLPRAVPMNRGDYYHSGIILLLLSFLVVMSVLL